MELIKKKCNYRITQLPSGYWCVWYKEQWVECSLPTRKAAEEYIKSPRKYYESVLKRRPCCV